MTPCPTPGCDGEVEQMHRRCTPCETIRHWETYTHLPSNRADPHEVLRRTGGTARTLPRPHLDVGLRARGDRLDAPTLVESNHSVDYREIAKIRLDLPNPSVCVGPPPKGRTKYGIGYRAVLAALQYLGECRVRDIAVEIDEMEVRVRGNLQTLRKKGLAQRVARGVWVATQ